MNHKGQNLMFVQKSKIYSLKRNRIFLSSFSQVIDVIKFHNLITSFLFKNKMSNTLTNNQINSLKDAINDLSDIKIKEQSFSNK